MKRTWRWRAFLSAALSLLMHHSLTVTSSCCKHTLWANRTNNINNRTSRVTLEPVSINHPHCLTCWPFCRLFSNGAICWAQKKTGHLRRRSGRAAPPSGEESVPRLIGRWRRSRILAASSLAPPSPARLRSAAAASLQHSLLRAGPHRSDWTLCVRVCDVCVFPPPFWSLMSTAAWDSSSRVMSSRFPLSAAWCSGENLECTHTHR